MAYTPTNWADGVTPVNAANLNKLEQGVDVADANADAAIAALPGKEDKTAKGAANGYASLDASSQVPDSQIPAAIARDAEVTSAVAAHAAAADPHTVYQLRSEKTQASGYASLDAGAKVPVAQLPDLSATYQPLSAKAAVNGYAPLDASAKVPAINLPTPAAAGADLSFDGDWVAGTYQDGDTVVLNGIAYLCVGGPTAVAPDPALWGAAALASTVARAQATKNATQSVNNTTNTALTWPGPDTYDTDTIHDPATNSERMTIKTAGVYYVAASVTWAIHGGGTRKMGLRVNGTTHYGWAIHQNPGSSDMSLGSTSWILPLAVNDYIEVIVWQNSGGALLCGGDDSNSGAKSLFEVARIGSL